MKAANAPQSIIDDLAGHGVFELLHDNVKSWFWFVRCETQWRVSLNGPVGLDYVAVHRVLKYARDGVKRMKRKAREQIFAEIGDYERGVLLEIRNKAKTA